MSFFTSLQRIQSTQRNRLLLSALVVVTVLGAAFALAMTRGTAEQNDQTVIAVIDGTHTVSKESFYDRLVAWHGQNTLTKMIDEILIVERAKADGVDVDAVRQSVDDYIHSLRLSTPQLATEEQWQSALAQAGFTEASFRHEVLMEQLLLHILGDSVVVTDEEVDALWDLYAEEYADLGPDLVKPYLRQELEQQKYTEAVAALFDEMYSEVNSIEYFLKQNGINLEMPSFTAPAAPSQDADDDLTPIE